MRILTLLCCTLFLSACGIKGALYLPSPAPGATQSAPAASNSAPN